MEASDPIPHSAFAASSTPAVLVAMLMTVSPSENGCGIRPLRMSFGISGRTPMSLPAPDLPHCRPGGRFTGGSRHPPIGGHLPRPGSRARWECTRRATLARVTNVEVDPAELVCRSESDGRPGAGAVEILEPRDVPLGGIRAMTVRRTLPLKQRSLIGAWCFADHYGPDRVAGSGGMDVAPHPHTGLQTVSWLFAGEIEHRDSLGSHAMVRPGELNLMTAGRGISHSEVSTPDTDVLHGVQLWLALPEAARSTEPAFEHVVPEDARDGDVRCRVFIGTWLGLSSPATVHTPLLGAELVLQPGGAVELPLEGEFEHGVLVDSGSVTVNDAPVGRAAMAYLPPGTA